MHQFEGVPAPHACHEPARCGAPACWHARQRVPVPTVSTSGGAFGSLGKSSATHQSVELEVEWLRRHHDQGTVESDRGLLEKVGQLLHSLSNRSELTRQAMQLAVEQFDAERGALLVEDEVSGTLEPVAQCGAEDATSRQEALQFSRKLVARVIEEGTGVLVSMTPRWIPGGIESVRSATSAGAALRAHVLLRQGGRGVLSRLASTRCLRRSRTSTAGRLRAADGRRH